jgi:hypothetical protein
MTLTRIQAFIAPLATPIAPALLLGNEMYQVMVLVSIPWWLSLVGASIAVAGLESSGALACYMAVKSWRRKNWNALALAVIGAIIYTVVVFGGILIMPQKRASVFAVMVFITLVAYLGYALYASFQEDDNYKKDVLDGQLAIMKERRLTLNAKTRLAKVEGTHPPLDMSPLSTGHLSSASTGQTGRVEITEKGQQIIDYLNKNGKKSCRVIGNDCDCSPETARKWLNYWEQS